MNIFISYARRDDEWLKLLEPAIRAMLRVVVPDAILFIDIDMEPGVFWRQKIQRSLESADLFILLGSSNFAYSREIINYELPLILKRPEAAIFPILLTDVNINHLPQLKTIQWMPDGGLAIHRSLPTFDVELNRVINALEQRIRQLGQGVASCGSPVPSTPPSQIHDQFVRDHLRNGSSPFIRLELSQLNSTTLNVDIITKSSSSASIEFDNLALYDPIPTAQSILSALEHHVNVRNKFASMDRQVNIDQVPIKFQIAFDKSVAILTNRDWENATWKTNQLHMSVKYICSRHISQDHAEPGALMIKPRDQIDYVLAALVAVPTHPRQNAPAWSQTISPHDDTSRLFLQGTDNATRAPTYRWLQLAIQKAEVLVLGIPFSAALDFLVVDTYQTGFVSHPFEDLERILLASLRDSGGPSLVILPPRDQLSNTINKEIALRLSVQGTPAILTPISLQDDGTIDPGEWDTNLSILISDLKTHGLIDVAVANARARSAQHGYTFMLYLRARSARLWYDPMFTNASGDYLDPETVWKSLRIVSTPTTAESAQALTIIIGTNFDNELSVSRRILSARMARNSGFALSRRDAEDLATVADYIEIKGSTKFARPHVEAFTTQAKAFLLSRWPGLAEDFADKSLDELTCKLAKDRLGPRDAFPMLANLKASTYITTYFHSILQTALAAVGRDSFTTRFKLPVKKGSVTPELPFAGDSNPSSQFATELSDGELRYPSIEAPLVYHAFGDFSAPHNMLLSRSDFLRFFEEYCLKTDPLTVQIRNVLGHSALIFLGFRPTSASLRMLLDIYRNINGNLLGRTAPRIAVQVDPEDDHTLDPDGARDYYRGLLSRLGGQAFIFWGPPDVFLAEYRQACPEAFIK